MFLGAVFKSLFTDQNALLTSMDAALEAMQAATEAIQAAMESKRPDYVPATATPFTATNSTLIDDTTVRAIKAAVASKKHWIHTVLMVNTTTAQYPALQLIQDTATVLMSGVPMNVLPEANITLVNGIYRFPQPIEVGAGLAIGGKANGSVGDSLITVMGWQQA